MRLLRIDGVGQLGLTGDLFDSEIPQRYAILSHTWAQDNSEEVTFQDLKDGSAASKPGYDKIQFCADVARRNGLDYFWVDTCCIDKTNAVELQTAITSMFNWYAKSERCFVYLSDVSSSRKRGQDQDEAQWKSDFLKSKWFTRGWTLQELLAPKSVEFFSRDRELLGDKGTLAVDIHQITGIPYAALTDAPLGFKRFSIEERLKWAQGRITRLKEDRAYSLLGILDVAIYFTYGEGDGTWRRLMEKINDREALRFQESLLSSLEYGSPFTRSSSISRSSEGTFSWFFDESFESGWSERTNAAKAFLSWLRHGNGVFLIQGKPGSGKSTLMKFLANHSRSLHLLRTWAAPLEPQVASFYFWLGNEVQSTFHGFACSLLFQLLQTAGPDLTHTMMKCDQVTLRRKRSIANWDEEELIRWLQTAASEVSKQTPLCFFIDALDECLERDLDRVVLMIETLSAASRVKFCISSRQETTVDTRLRGLSAESLKLHELTSFDISRYVKDELNKCRKDSPLSHCEKEKLISELVCDSQGVFLWAVLVARKLRSNIDLGDTASQLRHQLMQVPRGMNELYHQILQKSGAAEESRQPEAASYFKFLMRHEDRYYGVNTGDNRRDRLTVKHFVSLYEHYHGKKHKLGDVGHRVASLCEGFAVVDAESNGSVMFIHRTARDFFEEATAQLFLSHSDLSEVELFTTYVDALLTNRYETGRRTKFIKYFLDISDLSRMMKWCQDMRDSNENHKAQYLRHIEQLLSTYYASTFGTNDKNWVFSHAREPSQAKRNSCYRHDESGCKGDFRNYIGYPSDFIPENIWRRFGTWDRALDFPSLAFKLGNPELLKHNLANGRVLTQSYKNYLLLSAVGSREVDLGWIGILLGDGADANATFYWGLRERVKTSPWLKYLAESIKPSNSRNVACRDVASDFNVETVELFLDQGAKLEDRTVFIRVLSRHEPERPPRLERGETLTPMLGRHPRLEERVKSLVPMPGRHPRLEERVKSLVPMPGPMSWTSVPIAPCAPGLKDHGEVLAALAIEVNGRYLLDGQLGQCAGWKKDKLVSRSDVQGVPPYRRVLLLHVPCGNNPDQFGKVHHDDSELILQAVNRNLLPRHEGEVCEHTLDVIQAVWLRSPRVPSIRQYLGERGYYKPADDPEVIQSPIPMFEDMKLEA